MKGRVKSVTRNGRSKGYIFLNNGEIEYCYSEAEKRGITRPAFARGLDSLVAHGLIDVAKSGQGGRKGDKSLYAISDRWKEYGTDDFVKMKRPKDTRGGRGFAVYWDKKKIIFGNENVTQASNENVTRNSKQ